MSDTCQSCTRKFPRIAWLSLASAMTQNFGAGIHPHHCFLRPAQRRNNTSMPRLPPNTLLLASCLLVAQSLLTSAGGGGRVMYTEPLDGLYCPDDFECLTPEDCRLGGGGRV